MIYQILSQDKIENNFHDLAIKIKEDGEVDNPREEIPKKEMHFHFFHSWQKFPENCAPIIFQISKALVTAKENRPQKRPPLTSRTIIPEE